MKTVYLYGIGGTVAVIAFMALVKKKKPATSMMVGTPRKFALPGALTTYVAAPGDKPIPVAARFGISEANFMELIKANGGKPILMRDTMTIKLPPGVSDLGPRQFAQGKSS